MMNIFLSLIIPVYKAEEFIVPCLNSVFSQICDGVEVILVDDGTPDNSMAVVRREFDQWIKSSQLKLLEQRNMGPGAARNTGMRNSRGDYIAFLDSDDVVLDGYFGEVIDLLKLGVADIVEFGFKRFTNLENLSKESYRPLYNFNGLLKLSDVRVKVFAAGCWYPSTRIYRREVFDRMVFPEGTHYEDLMMIPFIYMEDLMVIFIDKPLLGYRYNPESITSKHTEKQLGEMYVFYRSISADTESDALKILKLKTARSLVFFYSELDVPGLSMGKLVSDIRSMRISATARKEMRLADLLFYYFPDLYIVIDRVRVPAKTILAKKMAIWLH